MKSSIRFFFFAFLALNILSGCDKKDSESDAYNKAIVKLLGKWTFVNASTNDYHTNADHISTQAGASGDFVEFMNNNRATLRIFAAQDTSKYTLIGGNKLVFDDLDKFDIKILTETELVFSRKTVYSSAAYKEETYSLRK